MTELTGGSNERRWDPPDVSARPPASVPSGAGGEGGFQLRCGSSCRARQSPRSQQVHLVGCAVSCHRCTNDGNSGCSEQWGSPREIPGVFLLPRESVCVLSSVLELQEEGAHPPAVSDPGGNAEKAETRNLGGSGVNFRFLGQKALISRHTRGDSRNQTTLGICCREMQAAFTRQPS